MATLSCAGNTSGSDGHPWYLRRLLGENFTRRARTKFPPIQCNKTAVESSGSKSEDNFDEGSELNEDGTESDGDGAGI